MLLDEALCLRGVLQGTAGQREGDPLFAPVAVPEVGAALEVLEAVPTSATGTGANSA